MDAVKLPETGYISFTIPLVPDCVFRRYPIDIEPPEGFVGFVNNSEWQGVGRYLEGRWCGRNGKPIARALTHWTSFGDKMDARNV